MYSKKPYPLWYQVISQNRIIADFHSYNEYISRIPLASEYSNHIAFRNNPSGTKPSFFYPTSNFMSMYFGNWRGMLIHLSIPINKMKIARAQSGSPDFNQYPSHELPLVLGFVVALKDFGIDWLWIVADSIVSILFMLLKLFSFFSYKMLF